MDVHWSGSPVNGFFDKLNYTRGIQQEADIETIRQMLPGCVDVIKTDVEQDKEGVDFVATLRRGAQVLIDSKRRQPGCAKFWRHGEPELALETWSVLPGGMFNTPDHKKKTGWTLCEKKDVDLILFCFHPTDSVETFLVGYQHLRTAFRCHLPAWGKRFGLKKEVSRERGLEWQSECVFVPASIVLKAIDEISQGDGGLNAMKTKWEKQEPVINYDDVEFNF